MLYLESEWKRILKGTLTKRQSSLRSFNSENNRSNLINYSNKYIKQQDILVVE